MLYVKLIIQLDKTDKYKPILIVNIMEEAETAVHVCKFAF